MVFYCGNAFAQGTNDIKARIVDSASNSAIGHAGVILLNRQDSVLIDFKWTDKTGYTEVRNLYAGKYILLISYPGYPDFVKLFTLDSTSQTVDFGNIALFQTPALSMKF